MIRSFSRSDAKTRARSPLVLHVGVRTPPLRSLGCQGRRSVAAAAVSSLSSSGIKLLIQGKHLQVTEAIDEYARKKLMHAIEPYAPAVKRNVDVRMSVRGGDAGRGQREQTIEVTIRTARHGVVRAEVSRADLYAAIDAAADKVHRSLRKVKEKAVARGTWPGRGAARGEPRVADVLASADESGDDGAGGGEDGGYAPTDDEVEGAKSALDFPPSVQRTKVFYLDRMPLSEALDHLEQVDHDFYIYLDSDSGHVQVCYKRNEGGHGVIITIPDNADLV